MLKLQWMLLIWCQYDRQQLISPSIWAEKRTHLIEKIVEPFELKWCVAADARPRASPACCVAALICFNERWKNKPTCCWCRRRTCVPVVRKWLMPDYGCRGDEIFPLTDKLRTPPVFSVLTDFLHENCRMGIILINWLPAWVKCWIISNFPWIVHRI